MLPTLVTETCTLIGRVYSARGRVGDGTPQERCISGVRTTRLGCVNLQFYTSCAVFYHPRPHTTCKVVLGTGSGDEHSPFEALRRCFCGSPSLVAALIRGRVQKARRRVEQLRRRRRRGVCARAALHVQRACRGFVGRRRAAARKKAASLDIWRAAREGSMPDFGQVFKDVKIVGGER